MTVRRNGIVLAQALDLSPATLFDPPRDDWRSRGLCSELPIEEADRLFYPGRGESTKEAKALCAACPVRVECLEFALNDEAAFYFGVWGGTSGRDRRKLRKTAAA